MKKLALLPLALAGMFSATAAQADDGLLGSSQKTENKAR